MRGRVVMGRLAAKQSGDARSRGFMLSSLLQAEYVPFQPQRRASTVQPHQSASQPATLLRRGDFRTNHDLRCMGGSSPPGAS